MDTYIAQSPYSKKYHIISETLNALTHGFTALLALVGMYFLLEKAVNFGNRLDFIAYTIFGISMFLLFLSSATYHTFKYTKANAVLRRIDHCSIFLLIAGTYTPFTLISIGGRLGVILTSIIWIIASLGVLYKIIWFKYLQGLSVYFYIGMGWIGVPFMYLIYQEVGFLGLFWLFLGGMFYSIGTIFYNMKNVRYMHVVWHFFVMGGAACMYVSIFSFI